MKSVKNNTTKLPRLSKRPAPGALPGTFAISKDAETPTLSVVQYNSEQVVEKTVTDVDSIADYISDDTITWVNVQGVGDASTFLQLSNMFGVHRLAMEDAVNGMQRPKIESYGEKIFIVLRILSQVAKHLRNDQLSIFLGNNFVLSIQEKPGDHFGSILEQIRESKGCIRKSGSDYLTYALIDAIIDSYFPLVGDFGEEIELVDEQLSSSVRLNYMEKIHDLRGDLMTLRRSIRPLRDALISVKPTNTELFCEETKIYLRDCYDHTNQLVDLLDNYRELCSHLRDYHMSIVSNRMNEVMKVLTITGTIFIPLSFITGLYGMNFDTSLPGNMPLLKLPFGYIMALSIMVGVAGSMLVFIWRKGWFSSG